MKKDMTSGKEWKLILLFTLPIMAGSLLQQLYNTVDGIVVGNFIGKDAFAGVGTCTPLTFLFLAFAMGLSVGTGVTVSQYFGARRYNELNAAIDTSLILMGLFGILFSILGFIFTPFLLETVLNTPSNILPYSITYFRIYCVGIFFQFIYNGIAFILRGVGDSKATLYFLLISTILNGVLAVLFVITFHWGVAGTAIATVIAQIVCAAVSYIYLRKRFKFDKSGIHFDKKIASHVLRFGIPSAIQQTIVSLGNAAMQRLVNSFGDSAIAAYSAGNRIAFMMFVPIVGFQAGLASFTGQNIGAEKLDRVKHGLRVTLIMSILVTIIVCILAYIFAKPIVAVFGLQGDALAIGIEQTRFVALVFVEFTIYMILGGVLQGSGDVVVLSVATLSALIIRVVTGYLAVELGILGYEAAWVTNPIGWSAALLITAIRYMSGKWKTKAVISRSHESVEQPEQPVAICADSEIT